MERRAESESSKVSSILTRCATSGAPNSLCLSLPFHRKGSGQNSPEGPPESLGRPALWFWATEVKSMALGSTAWVPSLAPTPAVYISSVK